MFSQSISSPFAILYVDLWIDDECTDSNQFKTFINFMCNTSQFVAVVPVPDECSATLVSHFM